MACHKLLSVLLLIGLCALAINGLSAKQQAMLKLAKTQRDFSALTLKTEVEGLVKKAGGNGGCVKTAAQSALKEGQALLDSSLAQILPPLEAGTLPDNTNVEALLDKADDTFSAGLQTLIAKYKDVVAKC